jgi:predicted RNase H-like HicB family nuclease
MRYVVLLRAQSSGTYVAVAPAAPNCTAEGKTREEALQRLRAAVQQWLAGAEITSIDVEVPGAEDGSGRNPWLETAGMFADDPTLARLLSEAYQRRDAERQVE